MPRPHLIPEHAERGEFHRLVTYPVLVRMKGPVVKSLLDHLVLERTGPKEATVGMISLPLPRELAGGVAIDHPRAAMHPVGWWVRHELPRRALAFVIDDRGVPETLRLKHTAGNSSAGPGTGEKWRVATRITKEKLEFKPPRFYDIASLRGVPATDCTTVEFELLLGYGPRELAVQFGASGPSREGGPYHWQNVQIDPLWENEAVQAVRIGGIIYNGDTYLWVDLYLLLFANGVAHAAAHFVNTKLHIAGYDFQGLPTVRLCPSPSGRGPGEGTSGRSGSASRTTPQTQTSPHPGPLPGAAGTPLGEGVRQFPADGTRFDLPGLKLNLDDAALLASPEHPGSVEIHGDEILWRPFARTFNPQLPMAPPQEWPVGFARTVRFQLSLSNAAPVVARYRAPAWWYAAAGEPWAGGFLPVRGRCAPMNPFAADHYRPLLRRGRFDAGSAEFANDGFLGTGLLHSYYHTGRPELFADGLDYCYYWADIAVDHTDFTVHQWVGGWPWKTCAYSKFRDVLYGYLETGDPYLLDTVEMAAEAYWMWFRANWPRCTIGRDAFEIGGWALLRRFLGSERARERTREFVRMAGLVLDGRGVIGGQLGGGPHPGYVSSLYMTGVAMTSLLAVAEAELEEGHDQAIHTIARHIAKLNEQWTRDDVEMFPSNFGYSNRTNWGGGNDSAWANASGRIYTLLARLSPDHAPLALRGLHKALENPLPPLAERARSGRPGDNFLDPLYHDTLLLGARVVDGGVEITPLGDPSLWPDEQTIDTPWGELKVTLSKSNSLSENTDGSQPQLNNPRIMAGSSPSSGSQATAASGTVEFTFACARDFPVILRCNGRQTRTHSRGHASLPASGCVTSETNSKR